ncbi:hypothetical protein BJX99DRAFT_242498 [Aspergillus californicus]
MFGESSHGRSPRCSISPRLESKYRRTPQSPISASSAGDRNGHRSPSRSRSRTRSINRGRGRGRSLSRSPTPRSDRGRSYSRSQSSLSHTQKSSKIIVEKLTKNVMESHLLEIFGTFGDIQRLDLPMNNAFMTNRGTAYILYHDPADAEAAIAHMHEAQLDGALLNVSIVLPKRAFSRSPPPASNGRGNHGRHRQPQERPLNGRSSRRSPYTNRVTPPRRYGHSRANERHDIYRPRSISRSRSRPPRRSRSLSYQLRAASPPNRRARARNDSQLRGRRRSPSYSSYDYSSRSRSRSYSQNRGHNYHDSPRRQALQRA